MDWDAIVRDHGPAVWRTARRLLGNRADAEECFQETFVDAVELVQRTNEPVRHWSALLVRLATARSVDRLRQRVRRSSREEAGETELSIDRRINSPPPDVAEAAEMSQRLRDALTHLPAKQSDVFCLHCLEGWSYREIAEHLGISEEDVGVSLHRARAALKERIATILGSDANSERPKLRTDEVSS
jgi:RNA polymerase sigma-70 factor (ECF subfamily)